MRSNRGGILLQALVMSVLMVLILSYVMKLIFGTREKIRMLKTSDRHAAEFAAGENQMGQTTTADHCREHGGGNTDS